MFNLSEVNMTVSYVEELLKTTKRWNQVGQLDIGVVTPYKKQANVIRAKLKESSLENITIGTAAELQGQDRQIIIISTVYVGNIFPNKPIFIHSVIY